MHRKKLFFILASLLMLLGVGDVIYLIQQIYQVKHETIRSHNDNQTQLPLTLHPEKNKSRMLQAVLTEGLLSELQFETVMIPADLQHQEDTLQEVRFVFHGGVVELVRFFARLNALHYPFSIDQLSVVRDKNEMKITLTMTMLCFYVEHHTRVKHKKIIQSDPFLSELVGGNKSLLTTFPVNQLKFAGFMRQSNHLVGIIKVPNGESFDVQVGDSIGIERAFVVQITEQNMVVRVGKTRSVVASSF